MGVACGKMEIGHPKVFALCDQSLSQVLRSPAVLLYSIDSMVTSLNSRYIHPTSSLQRFRTNSDSLRIDSSRYITVRPSPGDLVRMPLESLLRLQAQITRLPRGHTHEVSVAF